MRSDRDLQAARDEFVEWGKENLALGRSVSVSVLHIPGPVTAVERLQAEWEHKREMRGDAFKRVPRKRGRR